MWVEYVEFQVCTCIALWLSSVWAAESWACVAQRPQGTARPPLCPRDKWHQSLQTEPTDREMNIQGTHPNVVPGHC